MTTSFRGPLASIFERQTGAGAGELPDALDGVLRGGADALPVAPADDRGVWDLGAGHADRAALHDVLARAALDLDVPWPVPLASDAARIHRDADRETWEHAAFARQERLSRAAVAAAATLEPRWIDETADGVWLLCEQSSWCWPAHDDAFRRHGSVLAEVSDPFVDLGAGEVVAQLAWIDHLLGTQLDVRYPGLRARLRHEATGRVFEPFVRRRDWHWLGLDGDAHNWNPWIHGNLLVAALRLLDGAASERAAVVALAIEGIDRYVALLPDDGTIDEGLAYWWNGACRALEALEVLRHATRGRLDAIAEVPGLRATIAFPHRMHLGGAWYLSISDSQARPGADQPWHALHRAARRVGDAEAVAHAAVHRVPGVPAATETAGLGRLLQGVTDAEWLAASARASPLPRDVWLGSIEVLIGRERAGSSAGLAVAAKGGHNAEHHNHNDVGSFVVASDAVPVLVDAGRPTYTAETFGPNRYSLWPMQSSWHNVPEIRAVPQMPGAEAAASGVAVDISDEAAELALEIAAAYPVPGLHSWRRRVRLDRPGSGAASVVVEDAWRLDRWPDPDEPLTTVRLLAAGTVELLADGARVVPLDGATPVRLRWGDVPATLLVRPLDDPWLTGVWGSHLTRLDLDVSGRDRVSVTVTSEPPHPEGEP